MASASILLVPFDTSLLRKLKIVHEPNLDPFPRVLKELLKNVV